MARRRKWYVVIIGRNIGVFPNWLEAGPLVEGVSNAVHQSFPSEEEARQAFVLAFSKGQTRIVGDGRIVTNQHTVTSVQSTPTGSTTTSSYSYSNGSFSTIPSTPSTKTLSTCSSPRQHDRPQAYEYSNSKKSAKPGSSSNLRPVSYTLSEPAHNSSHHPTTSARPYNNTKKPTVIVPVETRVFKEDTQVSTPQSDPIRLSPSLKRPSPRPRAIVKTPSWLASYPKSHQPLSPLDSEYLALNNFRTGALNDSDQGTNFKPSPLGSSVYCTRTPRITTISPESNDVRLLSIDFSPPVRRAHVVHEHDKDPRSPMLSQAKAPVTGLNYISFARPSPSPGRDQLPAGPHGFEAPNSSLLFHPSRSTVQKEDH